MLGLAKSRNQVSLLVSVSVTRGGGLKVEGDMICPCARRCTKTLVINDERVCSPVFCFNEGNNDNLADPVSFCDGCNLSK